VKSAAGLPNGSEAWLPSTGTENIMS
jgi:hypothetical protein